jgi:hypothetical protein
MTRRAVRALDLKPPRPISSENFDLICRTSQIPTEQQEQVRDFLADVVAGFGELIARERMLPSRKSDRRAITRAINHLRRAEYLLKQKMGPAGLRALRLSGRKIAPAISDVWLHSRFPNDFEPPSEGYRPTGYNPLRPSPRDSDRLLEAENRLLDYRVDFVERWGSIAIPELLADQISVLEDGRRLIVHLPDGRTPLRKRAYMLAALAALWRRLGRRPTSGANSEFGAFCEGVLEALGWPTEGVNSALPQAITLSRRLYR